MDNVQKAFLDALAVGESGGEYNILYGGEHFHDYKHFPYWSGKQGPAGISHAAGRYQFQPATWEMQARKLDLKNFSPAAQDAAAWDLAATVYRHTTHRDLLADLTARKLDMVAQALHSTWTSLTRDKFEKRFITALKAHDAKVPR